MRIFLNKRKDVDGEGISFSWMKQDIHSHLIPGIDDGLPDVDTSLDFIRQLSNAGLKRFICTPHIFGDLFKNTPEIIHQALDKLQKRIREEIPGVTVSAAAEYMLDDYFMELLRKDNKLLTIKDNLLLTEFPYSVAPGNIEEMTFSILNAGYQPVLAHPERYGYYHRNLKMYNRLKELGFLFQMNLLSLTGYYGKPVKTTAKMLLKEELIDYIGTDLHHIHHLENLLSEKSHKIFRKYLGHKVFNDF